MSVTRTRTAGRSRPLVALGTALTTLAATFAVALVGAAPASAATICEQYGSAVVGNYIVQNNRWGTTATQCINTTSNGFEIIQQDGTAATNGAPTAYPSIFVGCHYGNCSPGTNLPKQISTIGSAPTSITYRYPSSGTYNASFDIWLNADTNVSGVQDTEIMIWLNRQGSIQPIGSRTGSATIAGRTWEVWTGNNGGNNVVSYLATSVPITSLSFDTMEFVRDTFTRGSQYGNTSWYLTSIQAGFEPWSGGVGGAVTSFSASIQGGSQPTSSPTRTATPTATRTSTPTQNPGTGGCTATFRVVNSWQGGYQGEVTVKNGSSARTSWTTSFSASGTTISQVWNGTLASSSSPFTVRNVSHNGNLGAGASTSYGFIATGSAPSSAPSVSCS